MNKTTSDTPIERSQGKMMVLVGLTHLVPHDYSSMIDIALATGDKVWFDELCSKLREGATQ